MITLTFPDGASREYPAGTTGREVVESIAKSLAKRTVAMTLDGTLTDLSVGRVFLLQQGVDHGVLEVRSTPPRHECGWVALPPFVFEKWRGNCRKTRLHVHHSAILVKHTDRDFAP